MAIHSKKIGEKRRATSGEEKNQKKVHTTASYGRFYFSKIRFKISSVVTSEERLAWNNTASILLPYTDCMGRIERWQFARIIPNWTFLAITRLLPCASNYVCCIFRIQSFSIKSKWVAMYLSFVRVVIQVDSTCRGDERWSLDSPPGSSKSFSVVKYVIVVCVVASM